MYTSEVFYLSGFTPDRLIKYQSAAKNYHRSSKIDLTRGWRPKEIMEIVHKKFKVTYSSSPDTNLPYFPSSLDMSSDASSHSKAMWPGLDRVWT